jgi:DNA polymerase-3 subunit alpha
LDWEKELLGTYLSEHPMEAQERQLLAQDLVSTTIDRVATLSVDSTEAMGNQLSLVGMVQRMRRITTKKGDAMAFVTLEGPGGSLDVVVFPRTFERFKGLLTQGRVLVVSGKLDSRPDREEHSLLADWFKEPHELLSAVGGGGSGMDSSFGVQEAPPSYASEASPMARRSTSRDSHNGGPSTAADSEAMGKGRVSHSADEVRSMDDGPPVADVEIPDNGRSDGENLPPLPEEPPPPPATLYITLQRTDDSERDFQKLAELHRLLKTQRGADSFVVALKSERHKPVELLFPNENTRITPDLRQGIASIVGQDNLRVVMRAEA